MSYSPLKSLLRRVTASPVNRYRMVGLLEGHTDGVNCMTISKVGSLLASGGMFE